MSLSKKHLFTCLILICVVTQVSGQSVPDSITKKIDALFKKWDNNGSPGFAVGVVRNDSLIFAKGTGWRILNIIPLLHPKQVFT
jgi:CubicO group peptidase (beta-lactamase class C family)